MATRAWLIQTECINGYYDSFLDLKQIVYA